jgi:HAD superfamily hydrolase (TIGR01509 family)
VIRALVFDFDGLILDTELPRYRAWAELYEGHGQQLSLDFWQSIIGRGTNTFDAVGELERLTGRQLDRQTIRMAHRRREQELVSEVPILPGVVAWRDDARATGVKLGLASSSSRRWVVGHLERIGLDGWQCISCGDDVAHTKPDPELYLQVLECLGVTGHEAIALEDSAPGIQAAKAAGLYVVAVPSTLTATHDLSLADLQLTSLVQMSFGQAVDRFAGVVRGPFRKVDHSNAI